MIIANNTPITNLIIKIFLIVFIIVIAFPVRTINYIVDLVSRPKVLTLLIFCLAFSAKHPATAQGIKEFVSDYQIGFESSFGIRSFQILSNIAAINDMRVLSEGGTIGAVCGARGLIIKIRQGFYYSASSVAHTIDEVRSTVIANIYPLQSLNANARLRPYLLIAMERNILRMHGYYDGGDHSARNRSVSEAPYLGKISSIQSGIGVGLEHRVERPGHFVVFFGEVRYGRSIRVSSSSELFAKTRPVAQLMMSVGVCFGYNR